MKSAALLALGAALLLAGCQSVNTVQRAQPQAQPNLVNDQRVITDQTLARAIGVVAINEAKVSGDLLKVQATLENRKSSARTVKYKFDWIGDDGMEISSPGNSWKTVTLQGGETRAVSSVATSPRVVDFRIKLQEP